MNDIQNTGLLDKPVDTRAGILSLAQLAGIQGQLMADAAHAIEAGSLDAFLESVGVTPARLAAQEELALRDYRAGQYESARRQFARLCRLKPGDPKLLKSLAACQQALGAYAQALVGYREALAAKPDDASCLLHSAQCLLHLSRRDDAARVLSALKACVCDVAGAAGLFQQAELLLSLCGPSDHTV